MSKPFFLFFTIFTISSFLAVSQIKQVYAPPLLSGSVVDVIENKETSEVSYVLLTSKNASAQDNTDTLHSRYKRNGLMLANGNVIFFPVNDYYLFHCGNELYFERQISANPTKLNLVKVIIIHDTIYKTFDLGSVEGYGTTIEKISDNAFLSTDGNEGYDTYYRFFTNSSKLITRYIPFPQRSCLDCSYDFNDARFIVLTKPKEDTLIQVIILSLKDGTITNHFTLDSHFENPWVKLLPDFVIVYSNRQLQAFNFKGKPLWKLENIAPIYKAEITDDVKNHRLYILNDWKSVCCVDSKNGSILWKSDAKSLIHNSAVEDENTETRIGKLYYSEKLRSLVVMVGQFSKNLAANSQSKYFLILLDDTWKTKLLKDISNDLEEESNGDLLDSEIVEISKGIVFFKDRVILRYEYR